MMKKSTFLKNEQRAAIPDASPAYENPVGAFSGPVSVIKAARMMMKLIPFIGNDLAESLFPAGMIRVSRLVEEYSKTTDEKTAQQIIAELEKGLNLQEDLTPTSINILLNAAVQERLLNLEKAGVIPVGDPSRLPGETSIQAGERIQKENRVQTTQAAEKSTQQYENAKTILSTPGLKLQGIPEQQTQQALELRRQVTPPVPPVTLPPEIPQARPSLLAPRLVPSIQEAPEEVRQIRQPSEAELMNQQLNVEARRAEAERQQQAADLAAQKRQTILMLTRKRRNVGVVG